MKFYDENAIREEFEKTRAHFGTDAPTVLDHLRFCIRHLGAGKSKSMDDRVQDDEMSLSFEELIGALLDAEGAIEELTREPDYPEETTKGGNGAKVGKGIMFLQAWDSDWCHVCGQRRKTWWLLYPDNAEHDPPLKGNEKRRWNMRICRRCILQMVEATMRPHRGGERR